MYISKHKNIFSKVYLTHAITEKHKKCVSKKEIKLVKVV